MKKIFAAILFVLLTAPIAFATPEEPVKTADEANLILKEFSMLMLDTLKEGKDFVFEQAPLICKEIVMWGIAYHGYHAAVGVLLFIFSAIVLFARSEDKSFKNIDFESRGDLSGEGFFWLARSGFGILLCYIAMNWFAHIEDLIKAYFASHLFIIEYLMDFIK